MVRSPTNAPGLPPTNWAHILITLAGVLCLLFLFFFAYYRIFRKHSRSSRAFVFRNRSQRQRLNESNPDDPTLQFHSNGLAYPIFCSLPTIQFRKKSEGETGQGNTDCAVCLGEFKEDEWLRYLPSCSHYFHTSCIDTWFQTHSSCPLCRSNVMDNAMDQDRNFVDGPFSLESLRREDVLPQRTGGYQVLFGSLQIQQLERNQEIPTESTQSQT